MPPSRLIAWLSVVSRAFDSFASRLHILARAFDGIAGGKGAESPSSGQGHENRNDCLLHDNSFSIPEAALCRGRRINSSRTKMFHYIAGVLGDFASGSARGASVIA